MEIKKRESTKPIMEYKHLISFLLHAGVLLYILSLITSGFTVTQETDQREYKKYFKKYREQLKT